MLVGPRITVRPATRFETRDGIRYRVYEGRSDGGTAVELLVLCLGVLAGQPRENDVNAFFDNEDKIQ